MSAPIAIPLTTCADQALRRLAGATGSPALAALDGATLLGERAMLAGMKIPGRVSAGGGCRLYEAVGDTLALNLSRPADRELLPALFEADDLDSDDDQAIAALIARSDAARLLDRGRTMGLAIACEHEASPAGHEMSAGAQPMCVQLVSGCPAGRSPGSNGTAATPSHLGLRAAPRVIDLSALWAGPLAGHLLWLAGAEVIKVESRKRPDAMRDGHKTFFALLNQGKASVALDFTDSNDRHALLSLIAASDIVIEAARPRALAQLGIDAAHIVRTTPGLVWMSICAHGAEGDAAGWVGFGDDCGVAGGLSAALRAATGRSGFVGDAIADPLTGVFAALAAWQAWSSRGGGRFGLAMSRVVAHCLALTGAEDPVALESGLKAWDAAVGKPFPTVARRPVGALPRFGEHSGPILSALHPS